MLLSTELKLTCVIISIVALLIIVSCVQITTPRKKKKIGHSTGPDIDEQITGSGMCVCVCVFVCTHMCVHPFS